MSLAILRSIWERLWRRGARLPRPDEIGLSKHSVDQFRARFRPALDRAGARAELGRLLGHGEVVEEMPAWLAAAAKSSGDGYLLIGSDMVLPLAKNERGAEWVAKTCLARGAISPARRAGRNEAAQRRRAAKHARRR